MTRGHPEGGNECRHKRIEWQSGVVSYGFEVGEWRCLECDAGFYPSAETDVREVGVTAWAWRKANETIQRHHDERRQLGAKLEAAEQGCRNFAARLDDVTQERERYGEALGIALASLLTATDGINPAAALPGIIKRIREAFDDG
jgi:hypothetical protein